MLLTVEKGIRGGMCNTVHRYAKAENKFMKDYDKNKESSYLKYWDVNNTHGWVMSQKLPVNKFEWIETTSQFNEDFIKNYNEESDEGYFLESEVQYPEKLHEFQNDLPFYQKERKLKDQKSLLLIYIIKLKMSFTFTFKTSRINFEKSSQSD